eukprot:UN01344
MTKLNQKYGTKSGIFMIEIVLTDEILMFLRIFSHYVLPSSSAVSHFLSHFFQDILSRIWILYTND